LPEKLEGGALDNALEARKASTATERDGVKVTIVSTIIITITVTTAATATTTAATATTTASATTATLLFFVLKFTAEVLFVKHSAAAE
jgi:hypothetical protein